jgi:hypothetical protein
MIADPRAHAAPLHSCEYRWLHAPATTHFFSAPLLHRLFVPLKTLQPLSIEWIESDPILQKARLRMCFILAADQTSGKAGESLGVA